MVARFGATKPQVGLPRIHRLGAQSCPGRVPVAYGGAMVELKAFCRICHRCPLSFCCN